MTTVDRETETDLRALDVAWDLEPLVDGRGEAGVDAMLDDAAARADGLTRFRGRVGDLDAAELAGAVLELAELSEILGKAGSYAGLRFSVDVTDPTRGALLARVEERSTAIGNELLFFELEWAELPDEHVDAAARRASSSRSAVTTSRRRAATGPHLLTEPEERILADKSVTGRSAWSRLFSELTSTIAVDLDGGVSPRGGAVAAAVARPRGARRGRRRGHRRARAGLAHARVRVQHAARRQGDRRPAPLVPRLDREPQPRQRGERRVGAGTRRRGGVSLRHPAALVRAEGAAARPRPARRLRPHGVGRGRPRTSSAGPRRATSCSTRTRRSRRSWPMSAVASSTSRGSTRPMRAGQAAGRLLRVHGSVAPPVPAVELDVAPPRRAHARARARSRCARVPGARSGRVPAVDSAHAGRDRVGVRRDRHVRPAARRDRRPRRAARAARRSRSKARSPRCSVRSR